MSKLTVYQFEVWDITDDEMRKSTRFGTPDAIKNIAHGRIIEGTGIDVDAADVGAEIAGFTARHYRTARVGFQTEVK